jgi:CheY-like chemotaxis protein
MLTSGERNGDLARCRELGVSAYLTKPVRREELRSAIVRAIANRPAEEAAEPATGRLRRRHAGPGAQILLVEDNLVNQRVAQRILKKAKHTVVIASNGKQALELLDQQPFDVILMDMQMPEMDGFEATAAIRKKERQEGGHAPIIAMTAHAMSGDRERCLTAGMDDYLSKPIRAGELLDLVAKYSKTPMPA